MIFHRKIFSSKSFLEKNEFLENIFRHLARTKKLRKTKIIVWQEGLAGFWQDSFGSSRIRLDPGHFAQIRPAAEDGNIPDSFGRNSASARFRRPTIAGFRKSDIKCTWKDEEKTVNRFPKIKEVFTVKLKMISVDLYFRPYQTL
jgi:hypothetical protein